MKWIGVFEAICHNNGELKWSEAVFNALTDAGKQDMLDVYLRDAAGPASFYIGLTGMATISETTLLSALTNEPSGGGYARQAVARSALAAGWPTLALDAGDYMATSRVVSFTATATWIMTDKMFMSTSADNTGQLISYAALSVPRTLVLNDILDITYKVKLQ